MCEQPVAEICDDKNNKPHMGSNAQLDNAFLGEKFTLTAPTPHGPSLTAAKNITHH